VGEFALRGRATPLSKILPLRGAVLKGRFSGGELSLSEAAASLWGGKVQFSGKISSLAHSPSLNFRGAFSGLALRQAAADLGTSPSSASGTVGGEFSLSGKASSPSLSLSLNGPELSAGGLSVRSLAAQAEGTLSSLRLTSFSARVLDAPVTAEGTLELKQKGKISLSASSRELDLRKLSGAFFPDVSLGGTAAAKVSLSGTIGGKLSAVFSGTSPLITFSGLLMEKAAFSLKPDGKGAYALAAEGALGKSILAVEGKMAFTPRGTEITLKNSKKIDLGATAAGLSAQSAGMVSGEADFTARGLLNEKGSAWEGHIRSSSLGFYRTDVTSVDIPFSWKDGRITIRDGKALYHGGPAAVSGMVDPATMRWEGNLTVKGMDLGSATERILGGKGSVTGKADLTARASGTGGMVGMVFGSGQLTAKDGSVSGFEALKSVSDTGVVKFSSVLASFNLDGRNIFLLPGSRVSAPVGDNVYRYFSASGSLGWNDSPLDLKCVGDINVRALNAFLGALQGIIAVDGNPLTDPAFLQRFLSGLLGGMSVRDFRETSFNLRGTWDAPVLTDLKVTSPAAPASIPRPNGSGKNETTIKITVEIPTGEGKDTSASTEDQVKKQLLENIMKQIIRPGTDDGGSQE
jgi:translocation and assembly module TamB